MSPDTITAEVHFGINTIYTVQRDGDRMQCRIKGKILKAGERSYNPIAPGDLVEIAPDPMSNAIGRILGLLPRRSVLARWNKKGKAPQVIAANAELAVCVTSPCAPPFRPRFIDRLIVAAESGAMSVLVLMNKCDLPVEEGVRARLDDFRRIGYPVHACSALNGEGMAELAGLLRGKTSVFIGQSGVGKSSVLNALERDLGLRVGAISAKHDRGSHTTNCSRLLVLSSGLRVVDTPGMREFEIAGVDPSDVAFHFREFAPYAQGCPLSSCLHSGEPQCAVRAAADRGEIHRDRYESYSRILRELRDTRRSPHG